MTPRKTPHGSLALAVVLGLIGIALLAGCPDNNAKGGPTPTGSASAATTAAPAGSATAGSSGSGW